MLDPANRLVFVSGRPVHLPAKEFDTLLLLVCNNGRALSKDEMLSAIWEDSFVEEGNLAKQISRLRKLLESSGGKSFIETIPKHGYRFSADVRRIEVEGSPIIAERRTLKRVTVSLPDDTGALPHPRIRSRTILLGAVVLSVILLGAVAVLFWDRRPPSTAPTPQVRSIAVLPFKVLGETADDEYLRIGLADAVVTKLTGLKKVFVRPTNAVRAYGEQEPIAAGRALGVDVVLDGNIQRVGHQIRLTAQLVNIRDGAILWAGTFDEEMTHIFDLQDALSEQVADAIEIDLTSEERSLLAKRYTSSNAAHEAYVKGRISWNRRTAKDLTEAARHFETAVREDPTYALAYVGLADTYSLLADYGGAEPREAYEKARTAALRALEIDDDLAEAHTSLAYVRMYYDWDWPGAESEYRRAIDLNPNYATARQWYSEYLTAMGRFDEALAEIRHAEEIDPLSPVINAGEVWVLYFARRYDEAIDRGRTLAGMHPEFAEIHEYLKRCYDQKGMYADAIASRQMRRRLAGLDTTETSAIRDAASAADRQTYWRKRLEQELEDARREKPAAFDMAEIYAELGDTRKSVEWLARAVDERHYLVMYLKVAPALDGVRSTREYAELVRRVGL